MAVTPATWVCFGSCNCRSQRTLSSPLQVNMGHCCKGHIAQVEYRFPHQKRITKWVGPLSVQQSDIHRAREPIQMRSAHERLACRHRAYRRIYLMIHNYKLCNQLTPTVPLSYSQVGWMVNFDFIVSVAWTTLLCCWICCCCSRCICCCVWCRRWWEWWWWWWWFCWCWMNASFGLLTKNSISATISDTIRPPIKMKKMPATFFSESSLRAVSCFSAESQCVFSNHHLLNSSVNSPLSINDKTARLMGTLFWMEVDKNVIILFLGGRMALESENWWDAHNQPLVAMQTRDHGSNESIGFFLLNRERIQCSIPRERKNCFCEH